MSLDQWVDPVGEGKGERGHRNPQGPVPPDLPGAKGVRPYLKEFTTRADENKLLDYNIKAGNTLHMVIVLRGG